MHIKKILFFPRNAILLLIKVYQKFFSPDHSAKKMLYPTGYCKFFPTCSEYMYKAIQRYGLVRGLALGIWRILRCHPWSKGGVDDIK